MIKLEEQRLAELHSASAIHAEWQKSGTLTPTQRNELKAHLAKSEEILQQINDSASDGTLFEQLAVALDSKNGNTGEPTRFKTLGEAFVKSEGFGQAQLRANGRLGKYSTGAIETGLDIKALTSVGFGTTDERPDIIVPGLNRPVIADLLTPGTLDGNTYTFLRETVATNNAAAVAESGVKPASVLTLERVTLTLSKIATVIKVPDEVFEDVNAARAYIDGRLTIFIQLEEEDQIMNGSGTPPNMRGILNTSGIQTEVAAGTPTAMSNFAALYNAITKIRTVALLEPDGIVIHPNDYARMRLTTDANTQLYGGGPFTGAYGNAGQVSDQGLWGLRTVISPAVAELTAVVAAWRVGAQLFRKGGISIEATNSDGTDFVSNITTIRAEERALLAVYRPNAFCRVTLDFTV